MFKLISNILKRVSKLQFYCLVLTTIVVYLGFNLFLIDYERRNIKLTDNNIKISLNTDKWTSHDVELTVNYTDSKKHIKEYSFDGGKTWGKTNIYRVTDNSTIDIAVKDINNKVYNTSYVVNNIDKTGPVLLVDTDITVSKNSKIDLNNYITVYDTSAGIRDKILFTPNNLSTSVNGNYKVLIYSIDNVTNKTIGQMDVKVVNKAPKVLPKTISLDYPTLALSINEAASLSAKVGPSTAYNKNVVWQSSNPEIATVDKTGAIETIKDGITIITATTANKLVASCVVYVSKNVISVQSVEITNKDQDMFVGDELQLYAEINPKNATNKNIKWETSDPEVATIDETGYVRAIKAGKVVITATTTNGKVGKSTFEVKNVMAESVTLNKHDETLYVGDTLKLKHEVLPKNTTDKTVEYTSSNPEVASVDKNGKVTALKAGKATITVTTINGKLDECKIKVKNIEAESISYTSNTVITLTLGGSRRLGYSISPTNTTDKRVTWTSSNPSVVSVTTNGVIIGHKIGVSNITVTTVNGKKATAVVTVQYPEPTSIRISQTSLTLNVGDKAKLSARVSPTKVNDASVTWKSSNPGVVGVSKDGTVTAMGSGSAIITALTSNGKTATCRVTVK